MPVMKFVMESMKSFACFDQVGSKLANLRAAELISSNLASSAESLGGEAATTPSSCEAAGGAASVAMPEVAVPKASVVS